jgi:hypothetical protein
MMDAAGRSSGHCNEDEMIREGAAPLAVTGVSGYARASFSVSLPIRRRLAAALLMASATSWAQGPIVEPLLENEMPSGCGCNFSFIKPPKQSSGETTFLAWAYEDEAQLRVDGKLERLVVNAVSFKTKKSGEISVGDSTVYVISNQNVWVRVRSIVTQSCPPDLSECESYGMRATVDLRTPAGRTRLSATGACGC